MTEKQDTNDAMHLLSQQFQSVKTVDTNLNQNECSSNDQAMSKAKNTHTQSTNATQDRKKNKSLGIDDSWMSNDLPGMNLPERIVFVVDTATEHGCTQFVTRSAKFAPLSMIKRAIEIFVNVKLGINPIHEFAILTLDSDSVSWICDFTNNRKVFLSYLEKIEEDVLEEDQNLYDLGPCFEKIFKNSDLECINGIPRNVDRVILIYARSNSIPYFTTGHQFFEQLSKERYFFVDSLYVHEPLSDRNKCQEIYAKLGTLDTKQTSFILEAGRNPAQLHANMAKLIAHPLQRARQDNAPYSIFKSPDSSREAQNNL